jgi:hypothetical protein
MHIGKALEEQFSTLNANDPVFKGSSNNNPEAKSDK